ncbi:hypothetical protein GCM10010191_01130 [Actinomadura vinacea]|uniref:Integral membrane protein n=1 Tax=Actinomadura vinacea TaxID=115336 RepID=A0ABN3IA91_9ACTN
MSTGPLDHDRVPAGSPPAIDLTKPAAEPAAMAATVAPSPAPRRPAPAGPAWIVIPARVVAVVIVLPLRLAYDLLALVGRGLMRVPGKLGRFLKAAYMALLHPIFRVIGQGAMALWSGLVWLWTNGVYAPLHWLTVVVILGGLRLFGQGTGRLARWFYSVVLAPVVRLLELLVARPAVAVWTALVWVLAQVGRGLVIAAQGIGTALTFLLKVLVVMPATGLWRYVLRPPLLGLAWLGRATGAVLARAWGLLATGVAALWAIFAGALVWAWRMLGRLLYWVARILFVIPAVALYRYLLRPIGLAAAATWRTLVVAPSRAVKNAVLVPIGQAARAAWHASVVEPARWVRHSVLAPMRATGRDVRLQVRRAIRGG